MVKVIVLGKNGMLGSAFFSAFEKDNRFDITGYDRSDFDMTNFDRLGEVILDSSADFVINCVGYTAVDQCESDEDEAFLLNCDLCAKLAEFCNEAGSTLIHFSTDYVFDGENSNGYEEDALVDPINIYGESKACGENEIVENCVDYYIVRTSWLFGPNGKNFVDTMLRLSLERDELNVVSDQIGSPTYTLDLVASVIENFIVNDEKPEFGVYHITNSDTCSWYDFACEIFRVTKNNILVNPITSEDFPTPAKRPRYSVLINTKLYLPLPTWEDALERYLG